MTLDLARLTLRQWMAILPRPMYRPQDLVELSGVAQPRVSDVLRGGRIYPAGRAAIMKVLGLDASKDAHVDLFEAMRENSAREARAAE